MAYVNDEHDQFVVDQFTKQPVVADAVGPISAEFAISGLPSDLGSSSRATRVARKSSMRLRTE